MVSRVFTKCKGSLRVQGISGVFSRIQEKSTPCSLFHGGMYLVHYRFFIIFNDFFIQKDGYDGGQLVKSLSLTLFK